MNTGKNDTLLLLLLLYDQLIFPLVITSGPSCSPMILCNVAIKGYLSSVRVSTKCTCMHSGPSIVPLHVLNELHDPTTVNPTCRALLHGRLDNSCLHVSVIASIMLNGPLVDFNKTTTRTHNILENRLMHLNVHLYIN